MVILFQVKKYEGYELSYDSAAKVSALFAGV